MFNKQTIQSFICIMAVLAAGAAALAAEIQINGQPVDQLVEENGEAVFTVDAINLATGDTTDLTYKWRGVADANVFSTDPTLTISPATIDDQDGYYCIVGIPALGDANSVSSDVALLGVKDKVAHYTFDQADFIGGEYQDISGYGRHAPANASPTGFVAGADGTANAALSLLDNPTAWSNNAGRWNPSEFTHEMSMSVFVYWQSGATIDSLLTHKREGGSWNDAAWDFLIQPSGTIYSNLNTGYPNLVVSNAVQPDQWTHLVLTLSANKEATLYVNGVQHGPYAGYEPGPQPDAPISLGARLGGSNPFYGTIDEFSFYNYALNQTEVIDIMKDIWELPPIIDTQPVNVAYPENDTFSFTVEATDPYEGTLSYQWYKDDVPLTGETQPTLTVTDNSGDAAGTYNCAVANIVATTNSDVAYAQVQGVIGHWPFDSSLEDAVGHMDANSVMTPTYVTGIDGQAIDFTGDPNYVEIYPTDYHGTGWSFTWWEKSTDRPGTDPYIWEVLVGSGVTHGSDRISFYRYNDVNYTFRIGDAYHHTAGTSMPTLPEFARQEWHFLGVAYNPNSATVDCFVDGELVFDDVDAPFAGFGSEITFGNRINTTAPADAIIDDIKLYNYPITHDDVIAEYFAKKPGSTICKVRPSSDIIPDCVVDLKDFAEIASNWLECGLSPVEACP